MKRSGDRPVAACRSPVPLRSPTPKRPPASPPRSRFRGRAVAPRRATACSSKASRTPATSARSCAAPPRSACATRCLAQAAPTPGRPRSCAPAMGAHFALAISEDADLAAAIGASAARWSAPCRAAGCPLGEADLAGRLGWLFGAEGQGVERSALAASAALKVSDPDAAAAAESLNVAAAAAVCFYDAPCSVDLPLEPELAQDGGGDLLDRLGGRVDASGCLRAASASRPASTSKRQFSRSAYLLSGRRSLADLAAAARARWSGRTACALWPRSASGSCMRSKSSGISG